MSNTAYPLRHQRIFRYLPSVIMLSGIMIAAGLGYGDYHYLTEASRLENNGQNRVNATNGTVQARTHSTDIGSLNSTTTKHLTRLFGQSQEKSAGLTRNSPSKTSPPDTRLNLILQGTFTNTQTNKASALIAQSNQQAKHFLTGEEITAGVTLVAIYPGKIILRRNGREESLKMPILKGEQQLSSHTSIVNQTTAPAPKYSMANSRSTSSSDIQQRLQSVRAKAKAREVLDNSSELD